MPMAAGRCREVNLISAEDAAYAAVSGAACSRIKANYKSERALARLILLIPVWTQN
jgi:hypothetical protein